MSATTFYWHDYETFGVDPSRDRPSQFAGIRTDTDFNIIGEPLMIYCQPAADMLPQPEACLITGITPQLARQQGVCESEFIRQIHDELAQPGTCGVGYNSIRFDDEVTRYTLYRNLYDPYAREWQNGNSRWDIIDMVRMCRALRPEGIEWPLREDGTPSFKLEQLTQANGLLHEAAHDALSDVYATIAVAKLIKEKQPRLFAYLFEMRRKKMVAELLDVVNKKPLLHTSGMIPASHLCTTLMMPLVKHPTNSNGVICFDLTADPDELLALSAEEISHRVFTPADELADGENRIPLKTIHLNRCPAIATTRLLDDAAAERLQLDKQQAFAHYQQLLQTKDLEKKLSAVFSQSHFAPETDPDRMLYSGAFFSDNDKRTLTSVRDSSPQELAEHSFSFEDGRLAEMLFRYRARNFPDTLNEEESLQWQEYCYQRLTEADAGGSITLETFLEKIEELMQMDATSAADKNILQQLLAYSDEVLA